jgi:hypothetical protein
MRTEERQIEDKDKHEHCQDDEEGAGTLELQCDAEPLPGSAHLHRIIQLLPRPEDGKTYAEDRHADRAA